MGVKCQFNFTIRFQKKKKIDHRNTSGCWKTITTFFVPKSYENYSHAVRVYCFSMTLVCFFFFFFLKWPYKLVYLVLFKLGTFLLFVQRHRFVLLETFWQTNTSFVVGSSAENSFWARRRLVSYAFESFCRQKIDENTTVRSMYVSVSSDKELTSPTRHSKLVQRQVLSSTVVAMKNDTGATSDPWNVIRIPSVYGSIRSRRTRVFCLYPLFAITCRIIRVIRLL